MDHGRIGNTMDHPYLSEASIPAHWGASLEELVAALASGLSVVVTAPDQAGTLLSAAAPTLAASRIRVLHVSPSFELQAFVSQLSPTAPIGDDAEVEKGFLALTQLDPSCDLIVLLVPEAHLLPHATLRYIEFALHSELHLAVALAGRPELADTLALAGFTKLRRRISLDINLPAPEPVLSCEATMQERCDDRREVFRALGGAAIAASIAIALWMPQLQPAATTPVAVSGTERHASPAIVAGPTLPGAAQPSSLPQSEPGPTPVGLSATVLTATDLDTGPNQPQPVRPAILAAPALEPHSVDFGPSSREAATSEPVFMALPPRASQLGPISPSAHVTVGAPEAALPTASVSSSDAHVSMAQREPAPVLAISTAKPPLPPQLPVRRLAEPASWRMPLHGRFPVHAERVKAQSPMTGQGSVRCRTIILHAQLGETPTHGDQEFLHDGCL